MAQLSCVSITRSRAGAWLLAGAIYALAGCWAFSQETDDAAQLEQSRPDIEGRAQRIAGELERLKKQTDLPADHWARAWAGSYYVGDGLGMNVRINVAPQAGITYTWHGCLGLYDGNHGDIVGTFDDDGDGKADGLQIHWLLNSKEWYDFGSDRYYFIRWEGPAGSNGRFYLVPEARMLGFANEFNEGSSSRESMRGAPRKYDPTNRNGPRSQVPPVQGMPQLSAKWARMLLPARLDAKVVGVGSASTNDDKAGGNDMAARLTLDKGSAEGVYLGMAVRVFQGNYDQGALTVDQLHEHSAEALFHASYPATPSRPLPAVGQVIRLAAGAVEVDAKAQE